MNDADREDLIDFKRLELQVATDPEHRRDLWVSLRELINSRSPEQVERLERAKGLR